MDFDPYVNDPLRWGASMAHHRELLLGCLEAADAATVAEVGAYAGDLTRVLVDWATRRTPPARLVAIDPAPQPGLARLAGEHPDTLAVIRRTSLEALDQIPLPDAVIIDGDHNHWTVTRELALIARRAGDGPLPLLLFHDVAWPHARRDDYFDPERIPAEHRHPIAPGGRGLAPGNPDTAPGGLPYPRSAAREGGPGNGVLTAVEDFAANRDGRVRLAVVPAFFGFGVLWEPAAPWADAVAELLAPWDGSDLLARLEDNRVGHIAAEHALRTELWGLRERQARQEQVLGRMLRSSAFRIAEMLSRLRVRAGIAPAQTVISRAEIRRALADHPPEGGGTGATG